MIHSLTMTFEAVQPSDRYPDGEVHRDTFNLHAFRGAGPKGANGYGASRNGRTLDVDSPLTEAAALRLAADFAKGCAERLGRAADIADPPSPLALVDDGGEYLADAIRAALAEYEGESDHD